MGGLELERRRSLYRRTCSRCGRPIEKGEFYWTSGGHPFTRRNLCEGCGGR